MAYIFHEDELPKLVSPVQGRERTFFVNKRTNQYRRHAGGDHALQEGRFLALSSAR